MKSAMEPENKTNNNVKPTLLTEIEIKAVEYTTFLFSVLFEKLKNAVSIPYVNKIFIKLM